MVIVENAGLLTHVRFVGHIVRESGDQSRDGIQKDA
jgi:hypothetical protein